MKTRQGQPLYKISYLLFTECLTCGKDEIKTVLYLSLPITLEGSIVISMF